MPNRDSSAAAALHRRSAHWPLVAALAALAAAFLALPALSATPQRLIEGCGRWIALGGFLEVLSVLGFVLVFKLVFGARMSWRRSAPASLRAIGASALLPGGGLIGPGAGAWSAASEKPSLARLARSMVAFVVLTNAPSVMVLGALGLSLWLGLLSGPHTATLTLLPAALALGVAAAAWLVRTSSRRSGPRRGTTHGRELSLRLRRPVAALRDGVGEAHTLLVAGDWKLAGAFAYYAFDNAVLWAAFHAYGRTPPPAVVVMGYLVGSLGSALPLPGGLGGTGGMIGALVLYGAPAAPAAAAVLLYRGISLTLALVLGTIGWTRGPAVTRGWRSMRDGRGSRVLRSRNAAERPSPRPRASTSLRLRMPRTTRSRSGRG